MSKRFVLKATECDLYIGNDGVLVNTIDNALKFVTMNKAIAYKMNCLTKKAQQYTWEAEVFNNELVSTSVYEGLLALKNKLKNNMFEKELSEATIKYLDTLLDILSSTEKVNNYMSKYDLALNDIQHYIELHTLTKEDCIKIIQLQQKILKKRRLCKDRLQTASRIESLGLEYWEGLISHLYVLNNRTYTNKVLGK